MNDEDRILERLGSRFPLPTDPLGGVADRLRRRARWWGVLGGASSVIVVAALVAGLVYIPADRSTPGQGVLPLMRTVEATGLSIDVPSRYSVLTSAQAFAGYRAENGAWSPLGLPRCGWSRPGSNPAVPTAGYVQQFVVAAFLEENLAPSGPTRRLLVLRGDRLSLDALTRCEIEARRGDRGGLLEQASVTVGGFLATRLVFAPVSAGGGNLPALNDREVMFLVDVGSARWALDFTALGQGTGPATVMADFDAIAATARFSG
jgi:hypothetical protein